MANPAPPPIKVALERFLEDLERRKESLSQHIAAKGFK
jgi:hypothetical protein